MEIRHLSYRNRDSIHINMHTRAIHVRRIIRIAKRKDIIPRRDKRATAQRPPTPSIRPGVREDIGGRGALNNIARESRPILRAGESVGQRHGVGGAGAGREGLGHFCGRAGFDDHVELVARAEPGGAG
jgi:hypothetical protein